MQFAARLAQFAEDRPERIKALLDLRVRRRNGTQVVGRC